MSIVDPGQDRLCCRQASASVVSGDEVILPSYTFVSTANAFVLRGAVPVFVDIREDTLNVDERLIEAAITPRTDGFGNSTIKGAAKTDLAPRDCE